MGIVIYIALSVLVGMFGSDRKLGFWGFLILSLIFTPLLVFFALLVTMGAEKKEELSTT